MQEFLGEGRNIVEYWPQVRFNLLSGRVRLIVVLDGIPRDLVRIVEFLNQQMSKS